MAGLNWSKVHSRSLMTRRGMDAISSYPKEMLRALAKDIEALEESSRKRLVASAYHKPISSLPRKAKLATVSTTSGGETPPWD